MHAAHWSNTPVLWVAGSYHIGSVLAAANRLGYRVGEGHMSFKSNSYLMGLGMRINCQYCTLLYVWIISGSLEQLWRWVGYSALTKITHNAVCSPLTSNKTSNYITLWYNSFCNKVFHTLQVGWVWTAITARGMLTSWHPLKLDDWYSSLLPAGCMQIVCPAGL